MKKNRRLKKYFPVKDDFNNFREPCQVCGGSRARAYALRGDYLAEDALCFYDPPRF